MPRAFITYLIEWCRKGLLKLLPAFMRKWRWELWTLPFILGLFFLSAWAITLWYPDAGIFDPGHLHRVFLATFIVFSGGLVSWIMIRAYYKEVWDHSEGDEFKEDYNMIGQKWRVLINVILFLGLLFAFVQAAKGQPPKNCVLQVAHSQVGVYEATGNNDGEKVEAYLASVNLKKGNPWCAAFVAWTYDLCGITHPMSGYCPSWFADKSKLVYQRKIDGPLGSKHNIEPGSVFGIYFPSKKRVAHVGIIEKIEGDCVLTIEGNTNSAGSRDGDGVYRKRRLISQVYCIATYKKGNPNKSWPR